MNSLLKLIPITFISATIFGVLGCLIPDLSGLVIFCYIQLALTGILMNVVIWTLVIKSFMK